MQETGICETMITNDFPEACAQVIESGEGWVALAPDTPETVPGNSQYHFLTKVLPHPIPLRVRIEWPQNNTGTLPGFYYPANHNFASVLHRICFTSKDLCAWQLEKSATPTGTGLEITLPPSEEPLYLAIGIPYAAMLHTELLDDLRAGGNCEVAVIGHSRMGHPLHSVLFPPATGRPCRGVFLLQGYQHFSETAGLYALNALARGLADGSIERGPFAWALVPCVNVDSLHGGWRADLMYTANSEGKCGNFNRDWLDFAYPEVQAARSFYNSVAARWPVLHALDFHMGWHSPETTGGGLSVFIDGTVPGDFAARERAFVDLFFQKARMEPFAWPVTRPERPNFSSWVYRQFGALAQTVEISRFSALDEELRPIPVSQQYYESFGPAAAAALTEYHTG